MIKLKAQVWPGGPQQGRLKSLRIVSAGYLPEKTHSMDWRSDRWGVGMVWEGQGTFQVGRSSKPERVQAPFYFFIWPGEVFRYRPETHWEESFLCWSGERCEEWERCGWLSTPSQVLPLFGELEDLRERHLRIVRLLLEESPSKTDQAKCLSGELLCMLHASRVEEERELSGTDHLEALARHWRREPWHPVDLESCAEEMGMSYAHFRRQFRRRMGETPYRYLAAQRIGYACRLLAEEQLSVKEIAAASGFAYVESFNRLFRQLMGQAPKQYRESLRALVP